jgi:hypothetical protein
VAGHIFQARPVWIYTQSNITNIIFTWIHNTNTEKKQKLFVKKQRVSDLNKSSEFLKIYS